MKIDLGFIFDIRTLLKPFYSWIVFKVYFKISITSDFPESEAPTKVKPCLSLTTS